jgi:ribosomal protein L32
MTPQMKVVQQRKGYKLSHMEYSTNQSENRKITTGLSKRRNHIPVISGTKKKIKRFLTI